MNENTLKRPVLTLIIMGLAVIVTTLVVVLGAVRSGEVRRAGFSVACQGATSIGDMAEGAEVVTTAVVVDVSPARDNVYAVTLQIMKVYKGQPGPGQDAIGPFVQLLFLKPRIQRTPEVRSIKEPRRYLEACIYAMDLKKGKKYNLFLAAQPGSMASKKGKMARFFMTAPPVLSSKKSIRKILAVTCPDCGKTPVVRSVDMTLMKSAEKVKLVCRIKNSASGGTQIFWRKDGQRISEARGKYKIRSKRTKSVLTVGDLTSADSGLYTCVASSSLGQDERSTRVNIRDPTSTTTKTTTTTTESSTSEKPLRRIIFPTEASSCPIHGYCLNKGSCSYIPWLGEMSCACAPGFQGARCEHKTTSALYSASLRRANTLCLFSIINPYHSC